MTITEIWIILAVIFFILELATTTFFLVWLGIGSLAAALTSYLRYPTQIQILIFLIIGILLIILARPLLQKTLTKTPNTRVGTERVIGQEVTVTQKITPNHAGKIITSGDIWTAISQETIEIGETAIVDKIDGTKLMVHKKKETEN